MEKFIFNQSNGNKKNLDQSQKIMQDYGSDALKAQKDRYDLDLYGEFVPTLFNWVSTDEERDRLEELIENDEKIWRD